MHRFFVPPESTNDPEILLPENEARHAVQVLRFHPGDRAVILNGQGQEILAEVTEIGRHAVRLRILQRHSSPPLPCKVSLFQAVPKSRAMDMIIQKATELGVSRIVPILSDRTVAQWNEATAAHKTVKWRTAAVEAAKQCGALWLPQIENPISLNSFLARGETADLTLLASLQPGAQHPRHIFDSYRSERGTAPRSLHFWVGPEGDYTPAEINAIRGTSAFPVTLGPLVLRSDTAALYCLAIASYELQTATAPSSRSQA